MKRANLFLVRLVTIVTLSIGFSSCGGSSFSDSFIGTWECKDCGGTYYAMTYNRELNIYADGSFLMKEIELYGTGENIHETSGKWRVGGTSFANVNYQWLEVAGYYMTADGKLYENSTSITGERKVSEYYDSPRYILKKK